MRSSRFLGVSPDKLKRPRTQKDRERKRERRGEGGCTDPSCVRMTNPFERPFSLQIPISTGAQGSPIGGILGDKSSALIRTAESRANNVSCGNRESEGVRMGWRCCLFALWSRVALGNKRVCRKSEKLFQNRRVNSADKF